MPHKKKEPAKKPIKVAVPGNGRKQPPKRKTKKA